MDGDNGTIISRHSEYVVCPHCGFTWNVQEMIDVIMSGNDLTEWMAQQMAKPENQGVKQG